MSSRNHQVGIARCALPAIATGHRDTATWQPSGRHEQSNHDISSLWSDCSISATLATRFLVRAQHFDGSWRDYSLDVGESTSWSTAFVLLRIAGASSVSFTGLRLARPRAATFLSEHVGENGGWGYNEDVRSDCDTTSQAILALQSIGVPPPRSSYDFVRRHRLHRAEFRTFEERFPTDSWAAAHPEVSAVALLALREFRHAPALIKALKKDIMRTSRMPCFWWGDACYTTYVASWLEVVALGRPSTLWEYYLRTPGSLSLDTPFRCSVSGLSALYADDLVYAQRAMRRLLALQYSDGSWRASAALRYARNDCVREWRSLRLSVGPLHYDANRIFTTATAVTFLSRFLSRLAVHQVRT